MFPLSTYNFCTCEADTYLHDKYNPHFIFLYTFYQTSYDGIHIKL